MKKLTVFMLILGLFALPGCGGAKSTCEYTSYDYFDTVITVKVETDDNKAARAIIKNTLARMDAVFDYYEPHEGVNGLYALNRAGAEGLKVEPELYELLESCKSWQGISAATDVTLGALYEVWHDFREGGDMPTPDDLRRASATGGWDKIELTEGGRAAIINEGTKIDMGAAAKGYAAGKLGEALREAGMTDFIISAGGNVVCGERSEKYRVGIQSPDGEGYAAVISICNLSAVTSGGYQRYRDEGGVRYHHIIDPATMYPGEHGIKQVTVICEDSAFADFMSTALFLTDTETGMALAEKAGVDAVWLTDEGEILMTDGARVMINEI